MEEMTFESIHSDIEFENILEDSFSDFVRPYARRIPAEGELCEEFFQSYWELGKTDINRNNFKKVRSHKGVSMNLYFEETINAVKNVFLKIRHNNPAMAKRFCIFSLIHPAGVVVDASSKGNPHHYGLYKSDQFEFGLLNVIKVEDLD